MPLLRGKTFVICPKTGKEVQVQTVCARECAEFKHASYQSYAVILVSCKYGEKEEKTK